MFTLVSIMSRVTNHTLNLFYFVSKVLVLVTRNKEKSKYVDFSSITLEMMSGIVTAKNRSREKDKI